MRPNMLMVSETLTASLSSQQPDIHPPGYLKRSLRRETLPTRSGSKTGRQATSPINKGDSAGQDESESAQPQDHGFQPTTPNAAEGGPVIVDRQKSGASAFPSRMTTIRRAQLTELIFSGRSRSVRINWCGEVLRSLRSSAPQPNLSRV